MEWRSGATSGGSGARTSEYFPGVLSGNDDGGVFPVAHTIAPGAGMVGSGSALGAIFGIDFPEGCLPRQKRTISLLLTG